MRKHTSWPVIKNRRARHDYEILDTVECGIALRGNEVKSLRAGSANFTGAYCSVENGRLILHGMYIARHGTANLFDVDEKRNRMLLAHASEIRKMSAKVQQDGITLIPLEAYWSRQYCKIRVAVCRGKHNYDKRQDIKARDQKREMERTMRY